MFVTSFKVQSPSVRYEDGAVEARVCYPRTSLVVQPDGTAVATPVEDKYEFRTDTKVGRVGVMLVGLGGNNGSSFFASIIANREGMTWGTKDGEKKANYLGSLVMASTTRVGHDAATGEDVFCPLRGILPMAHPNDLIVDGWDISSEDLGVAMKRAQVLDYDLQKKLMRTCRL